MSPEKSLRLIRLPDVERLTSLKRSAIYKRVSERSFPQPVIISSRCTVWKEAEVIAWIEALPRGTGERFGAAVVAA